ncbi:MAG: hypothetical protein ACRDOI_07760 [Trebonia sp.]
MEEFGVSRAQLVVGAPFALAVSRFRFAKLRRDRPRPYALAEVPPHMPRILWSEGYGQGLTEIVLAFGHPHEVNKPLIQVQTCFSEEDCYSPSLEEAITRAEHGDAYFARLEWVDAGDHCPKEFRLMGSGVRFSVAVSRSDGRIVTVA